MKPLASYLDAYRAQRLNGVDKDSAWEHMKNRLLHEHLTHKVPWFELRDRAKAIEAEIAEEIAETPDPAA